MLIAWFLEVCSDDCKFFMLYIVWKCIICMHCIDYISSQNHAWFRSYLTKNWVFSKSKDPVRLRCVAALCISKQTNESVCTKQLSLEVHCNAERSEELGLIEYFWCKPEASVVILGLHRNLNFYRSMVKYECEIRRKLFFQTGVVVDIRVSALSTVNRKTEVFV